VGFEFTFTPPECAVNALFVVSYKALFDVTFDVMTEKSLDSIGVCEGLTGSGD
jgi:hypothetical protein